MKIPVIFESVNVHNHTHKTVMVYNSDISRVETYYLAYDPVNRKYVDKDYEGNNKPISVITFNNDMDNLEVFGSPEDIQNTINAAIVSHEAMIERARRTPLYATFESAIADKDEVINLHDIDLSKAEEDTFEAESFNPDDKTCYTTTLPFHKYANREPVRILGSLEEVTQKINDALNNAPSAE